jgi:hypothetical protein
MRVVRVSGVLPYVMWMACAPPRPVAADAVSGAVDALGDASAEASADGPFFENRPTTGVLVSGFRVAWSQIREECPLEDDPACPANGPTVSTADLDGTLRTSLDDRQGTSGLVGDDDALFFIGGAPSELALFRVTPSTASAVQLSGTWTDATSPPVIDGGYVYWFDAHARGIRRASRSGDGSDATTIATPSLTPSRLTSFGGFLWWNTSNSIFRTPVAGGEIEAMTTTGSILATAPTGLFVDTWVGGGSTHQIAAIGMDGTTTVIVDAIPQYRCATWIVVDGDDLFWRAADGALDRTSISHVAPSTVTDAGTGPFGVTSSQILVDFTRHGFRSIPR